MFFYEENFLMREKRPMTRILIFQSIRKILLNSPSTWLFPNDQERGVLEDKNMKMKHFVDG
jgi:hypothetical protein